MADTKAILESIARSFGYYYGFAKKVRVNTDIAKPYANNGGQRCERLRQFLPLCREDQPLGNANAEDCANYCVLMFSDYTKMVTMQNLFHDGGFSFTGVSAGVVEEMMKGAE